MFGPANKLYSGLLRLVRHLARGGREALFGHSGELAPEQKENAPREFLKAEDIFILHLSDLHISKGELEHAHNQLIQDVGSQLLAIKKLIIVVTGDVVQACDYSQINKEGVCKFFGKLSDQIPNGCKVLAVEIVPGNHEIELPVFSNGFNGGSHKPKSKNYDDLRREILKCFSKHGKFDSSRALGITPVRYHDRSVCLVRVDTSWTKTRAEIESDIKKDIEKHPELAGVGEDEIKSEIEKQAEEIKKLASAQRLQIAQSLKSVEARCEDEGHPVACTIVLSHYPITWLLSSPAERIRDFIYNKGLSDVNLWLCGHAHTAQLYFNNDDSRSTLMLMTGVGRKVSPQTKHRYSVYQLNLERNVVAVRIRAIGVSATSEFDDDESLYGNRCREFGFYSFPLMTTSAGAFHHLNAVDRSRTKDVLLDDETLRIFRELSLRMGVLYARLQLDVQALITHLEDEISLNDRSLKKLTHAIFSGLDNGVPKPVDPKWKERCRQVMIKNHVLDGLLTQIVSQMYETITMHVPEAGIDDSDSYISNRVFPKIKWRIHFRRYAGCDSVEYDSSKDYYDTCSIFGEHTIPRQVSWEGMISKVSANREKALIYSVCGVSNPIKTRWSDFITGAPEVPENFIRFPRPLPMKERPLLTYGISVGFTNFDECRIASKIFYGLDFSMLNHCVSYALNLFVQRTRCDLKALVSKLSTEGT